jgi:chromosomal replication initiator protein
MSNNQPVEPTSIWDTFLSSIEGDLSRHVLDTWLKPVRCTGFEDDTAVLEVRDQFFRDWLHDHYIDIIRDRLSRQLGSTIAVRWVINPELARSEPDSIPEETTVSESADHNNDAKRVLNQRYHFERFVAGPSNQFAFAACKAVAENPAQSYNPLFIFGGTGLGKTHLLCAIGHHILKANPNKKIIYTSSEQFMNEVINGVRYSTLDAFHSKYRQNCDVLLMDDIQLIAGKERTQHEFFHVFNTMYDSQRQIVVTSDKLPHEIPEIEERLRTRFQWGLIADIQPPEMETRVAILRQKASQEGLNLSDDVCFFLAKNIRSNVRELEGAFVRVMAHASLTGGNVTVDYTKQILADLLASKEQVVSVEAIQKTVAQYFSLRVLDLKSSRRHKTFVRPRQVAMYLARKHAGASYPDLGSRFGDRDHTTVMSACKKIDGLLKSDPTLRGQVLELERQLDISDR